MLKLVFIRHGATAGNLEKRYIGRTDEGLTEESKKTLAGHTYPAAEAVFVSPMKRCRQTAEIIYPFSVYNIADKMRECDFGRFEGKNYIELSGDSEYQAWIDSNGTLPFPGGESSEEFKERCINTFSDIAGQYINKDITLAFVIHGGTIMSILEHYAEPQCSFYDWMTDNGNGYEAFYKNNKINTVKKLW